jgi:hypothetical protein
MSVLDLPLTLDLYLCLTLKRFPECGFSRAEAKRIAPVMRRISPVVNATTFANNDEGLLDFSGV